MCKDLTFPFSKDQLPCHCTIFHTNIRKKENKSSPLPSQNSGCLHEIPWINMNVHLKQCKVVLIILIQQQNYPSQMSGLTETLRSNKKNFAQIQVNVQTSMLIIKVSFEQISLQHRDLRNKLPPKRTKMFKKKL